MPDSGPVPRHALVPHPSASPATSLGLSAAVWHEAGILHLEYILRGDPQAIRLSEPRPPAREDGLWRQTCFEMFACAVGRAEYRELNFSPSGAWAAYAFTGYRSGMADAYPGATPAIEFRRLADHCVLKATLELERLALHAPVAGLRLGLSAVIEDTSGQVSYWALRHPSDRPDFHHADSFLAVVKECA